MVEKADKDLEDFGYSLEKIILFCHEILPHFEQTVKELGIDGKWQINKPGSISTPQDIGYVVSWVEPSN